MAAQEIKTMQLYNHLERFDKELVERGLGLEGPLDAEALSAIDSMHYHGVKAVDEASAELKLDASSKVLEIGSGLGGVVRRVASTTGCRACGLELQDDVSAAAAKLTARCGLGGTVEHVVGDAISPPPNFKDRTFTHVLSFLCFLHIKDTQAILKAAYDFLEPGGALLVEDFYDGGLTDAEKATLEVDVFAHALPTRPEYEAALAAVGFEAVEWTDLTASWTAFTNDRCGAYVAAEDRHVRVHGKPTFESQKHFYTSVAGLFKAGHLGGVKYVATKPLPSSKPGCVLL